jgi:hypothetical protein
MLIEQIRTWLSKNLELIQVLAVIVQTFIAAFMLWTLFQNQETLSITRRQLESSIEPVLDMAMFGSTLRLTNDGTVAIRKVESIAIIAAQFDLNTQVITNYQVVRGAVPLRDALETSETYDIDLSQHVQPVRLAEAAGSANLYCLALRYRRAADMKRFVQVVPFFVSRDTQTGTTDIYMPMFNLARFSEGGAAAFGDAQVLETAKQQLLELYKTKVAPEDV